jgi:ClpP class serine protease
MSRESRKTLIQEIEKKRKSKVITYITNDRQGLGVPIAGDVVSLIHEHILSLKEEERSKLDFFIYSRGGQSDVPWAIVSMFREYSKKGSFSVLIPYRAHSAATVIALGADEIVMTKKSRIGSN